MTKTDTEARLLEIEGLSKRYGNSSALSDVSLAVTRGEFVTFLGPSGSGKTTLLMAIAGFVTPSAGTIRLEGRDIARLPPEKRELGVVFQGYALFPHMTVFGNVAFPLEVKQFPKEKIPAKVAAVLELVGLAAFADRKPAQLSGGQQQRVALARALVFDPAIVLLDEPLSALDRLLRVQLQDELKRLHRKLGRTFLNVTHDQDEALSLSTVIAVMNRGRIVQLGSPTEIYERPATAFVASFVGRSNVVEATVSANAGGAALLTAGGETFAASGIEAAAGERVMLSLRPEKLALAPRTAALPNGVSAKILDVTYHGASVHILADTPLGEIRIEQPTGSGHDGFQPDDAARLVFPDHVPRAVKRDDIA